MSVMYDTIFSTLVKISILKTFNTSNLCHGLDILFLFNHGDSILITSVCQCMSLCELFQMVHPLVSAGNRNPWCYEGQGGPSPVELELRGPGLAQR